MVVAKHSSSLIRSVLAHFTVVGNHKDELHCVHYSYSVVVVTPVILPALYNMI